MYGIVCRIIIKINDLYVEPAINNSLSLLDYIEKVVNIFVSVIVAFGGCGFISYLRRIREKSLNAIFGYYAQLKVRLHYFQSELSGNSDIITDRFVPSSQRKEIEPSRELLAKQLIKQFASSAKDTIQFLKISDNQMPPVENWAEKFNCLLEFLEDSSNIDNDNFFKWTSDELQKRNDYFNLHIGNINSIIDAISKEQDVIAHRLHKRGFIKKIQDRIKQKK